MIKNESGEIATLKLPKHAEKAGKNGHSRPVRTPVAKHSTAAIAEIVLFAAPGPIIGKSRARLACQSGGCVIRYVLSRVYAMGGSPVPALELTGACIGIGAGEEMECDNGRFGTLHGMIATKSEPALFHWRLTHMEIDRRRRH